MKERGKTEKIKSHEHIQKRFMNTEINRHSENNLHMND